MIENSARAPGRSLAALAAGLALVVATSFVLRYVDWGAGPKRGLILLEALAAMVWPGTPGGAAVVGPRLRKAVELALALACAVWLASAARTTIETARSGIIPLDQGQTSYRAARLLLKGENPYGFGALVDFQTFYDRLAARQAAGIGPAVAHSELSHALRVYDADLGAASKAVVLPPAPSAGPAALEAHLLGYKYGPLLPLLAVPLAALGLPAGVMALNAAATFACVGALFLVMRDRVRDAGLAALGALALLCDNTLLVNYIQHSATDVYALLFSALAVLAVMRGRTNWAAAALAVAFGCKIFPSALLFPMLLQERRVQPALVFAGVAALIYAPFAAVDLTGVMHNVFLWPAHLGADSTSWVAFAPPAVGLAAKAAGLAGIAWVWARRLTGREPSLFRTLALVALIALVSSGAFHNNYAPWASIWIVAALVERFGLAREAAERAPAAPARLAFE